jgi:capsule polysaccharide export protein KpsE/RkpR
MTEAEIMEQINQKRTALEQVRSGSNPNAAQVQTLEAEIKQLESSLTSGQDQPKRKRRAAFLDECAG